SARYRANKLASKTISATRSGFSAEYAGIIIGSRPSVQQRVDAVQLLAGQHFVNIQQDLHFAFDLRHPEQIAHGDLFAEIRRVLDFLRRQIQNLADAVHDDPHQHAARLALNLGDDNTRALGILRGGQAELKAEIDHRHHLAAQVDDAPD